MPNLYSVFLERTASAGERSFLVRPDGTSLSYAALDRLTAAYAGALIASGAGPGERVAAQVDKSPEAIALYLACLRTGAIFIPLNTAYTPDEVRYFMQDAEPVLLICRPADTRALQPAANSAGQVLTLDAGGRGSLADNAARCAPDIRISDCNADDPAAIVYTSGTTGRSKGAVLTHGNLASNALTLHALWGFEPGDVLLHALPTFHVHGLFVALHTAMLNASTVLFLPKFEAGAVRAALRDATVMMGVPTFYTRLLEDPGFGRRDCAHMRLFISGSAPLLPETFEQFHSRTGHRILERYGMTEAGMIASNPLHGERIAGTVGYALPGVELRLRAGTKPAATAETGEIEIRGPNVFTGYWRMPEKTAGEFTEDGFFRTGDLGRLAADGRLSIVGRAKDLIISGGYNIYPREIEALIDAVGGVAESAVIGVPHADFGEGVVAVIVPDEDAPAGEDKIRAALNGRLARFKHPKHYVFVDTLPRNALGKVEKARLREACAGVLS